MPLSRASLDSKRHSSSSSCPSCQHFFLPLGPSTTMASERRKEVHLISTTSRQRQTHRGSCCPLPPCPPSVWRAADFPLSHFISIPPFLRGSCQAQPPPLPKRLAAKRHRCNITRRLLSVGEAQIPKPQYPMKVQVRNSNPRPLAETGDSGAVEEARPLTERAYKEPQKAAKGPFL